LQQIAQHANALLDFTGSIPAIRDLEGIENAEHSEPENSAGIVGDGGRGGHDGPEPVELVAGLLFGRGCLCENWAAAVRSNR